MKHTIASVAMNVYFWIAAWKTGKYVSLSETPLTTAQESEVHFMGADLLVDVPKRLPNNLVRLGCLSCNSLDAPSANNQPPRTLVYFALGTEGVQLLHHLA